MVIASQLHAGPRSLYVLQRGGVCYLLQQGFSCLDVTNPFVSFLG